MTLFGLGVLGSSRVGRERHGRIHPKRGAWFLGAALGIALGASPITAHAAGASQVPPTLSAPILRDISLAMNPGLAGPNPAQRPIKDFTPEVIANCTPGSVVAAYDRASGGLLGSAPCGTFPPGSDPSQHSDTLSYLSLPGLRPSERVDVMALPAGASPPPSDSAATNPVAAPPEIRRVRLDAAHDRAFVDFDAPVTCNQRDPHAAQQFSVAVRPTDLSGRSIAFAQSLRCPAMHAARRTITAQFRTGTLSHLHRPAVIRVAYDEYGCYAHGATVRDPLVRASSDADACSPSDADHVPSTYEYVALGRVRPPVVARFAITAAISSAGGAVLARWRTLGAAIQCELVVSPANAPVAASPSGVVATLPCAVHHARFTLNASQGATSYAVSLYALGPLPRVARSMRTVSVD